MGHLTSRSLSARSLKCRISDREWGSTALITSWNLWLLRPRLKIKGSQTTVHAKRWWRNLKLPTNTRSAIIGVTGHTNERSLANYEDGDENEQRLISSIIKSVDQARTSIQRRPLQNVALSSAVAGKHTDDDWSAVDGNQQFSRLSSNHQLPAQPNVSRTEVQCSKNRTDCSWLLNFDC